jgi:hypothetical protein
MHLSAEGNSHISKYECMAKILFGNQQAHDTKSK